MNELSKRILTSIFLLSLLVLAFLYSFILVITLILISVIAWIEINGLVSKIFTNNDIKSRVLKFFFKTIGIAYLSLFSFFVFTRVVQDYFSLNILYLFLICICSDIGGFSFGKFFKGKKLTKLSPNKTISGAIGSFILPFVLIPFHYYISNEKFNIFPDLIIITLLVSLFCQLGDLFISYIKREAKVKDTGDILPGHGGILDRIDGILLALPIGIIIWELLI